MSRASSPALSSSPQAGAVVTAAPAWLVWTALWIVYLVWGSTYLGILLAIDTIPVFLSMGIRFVIAGGLLYVWAVRRGDVTGDRPGRRQWAAALIVGALLFVGGNSLVAWSETRVDTGIAALLIAACTHGAIASRLSRMPISARRIPIACAVTERAITSASAT